MCDGLSMYHNCDAMLAYISISLFRIYRLWLGDILFFVISGSTVRPKKNSIKRIIFVQIIIDIENNSY